MAHSNTFRSKYDNNDGRLRGRAQQERRLRIWAKDPHCQRCGKLVEFNATPGKGFHLDHRIALHKGGKDDDANCQVLCIPTCHDAKTAEDMGHRKVVRIGEDGFPIV